MNGGDFEKSLLIDVLLIASFSFDYDSKLPIVLFSDSTSRVRYSDGYTCQYERGKEPKQSGKRLLSNYNPHRLDGKKYSNSGNSPVNYKMKIM